MITLQIAIILAGGTGSRFGSKKPKQFFLLNGRPLLFYSINAFIKTNCFDKVILVLEKQFFRLGESIINQFFSGNPDILICEGGETRQHSLKSGVDLACRFGGSDCVIVSHCAARPVLPQKIIHENIDSAAPGYSVNTVRRMHDTMLYTFDDGETRTIDRNRTFATLTPQTFYAGDYVQAFNTLAAGGENIAAYTCACSLMQAAGYKMKMIVTDEPIHKVTLSSDITVIKQHLKQMNEH